MRAIIEGDKKLKEEKEKLLKAKEELEAGKQTLEVTYNTLKMLSDRVDEVVATQVDTAQRSLKIKMDDRLLTYTAEHFAELEIAYAVTVHKSQGSEFPAVVIPVSEVPEKLCYRNLLYTGVTRAKKLCILAGSQPTVKSMVDNVKQNLRYSGLAELLGRAKAGRLPG